MVNRCPHARLEGIYGDAIIAARGYRLRCVTCGRLLDGPVTLATEPGPFTPPTDGSLWQPRIIPEARQTELIGSGLGLAIAIGAVALAVLFVAGMVSR